MYFFLLQKKESIIKSNLTSDKSVELTHKEKQYQQLKTGVITDHTHMEDVVFIINKLIFIRTLDSNGIVPVNILGKLWSNSDQLYPYKEKDFFRILQIYRQSIPSLL